VRKEVRNLRKAIFVLLLLPLFFFGSFVSAQETELNNEAETTEAIEEETADILDTLPEAGLTPDSPLYFLDTLGENIGLALARSPEAKAKKAFKYSEEKLAEAEEMAEESKEEAVEEATDKHEDYLDETNDNLDKAKALGKDADALAAHVAEKTLKHQAVLSRVYDKLMAKGNENAAGGSPKSNGEKLKWS